MKKLITLATAVLCLNLAQAAQFKVSKGNVNFTAKGFPAFITIAGKTTNITGILTKKDEKLSGNFSVDLTTLETGMDLRDDHMKNKYLKVGEFPKATLILPSFTPEASGTVQGELLLKGVKKPIKIDYTLEKSGGSMAIKTNFELLLNDFKVGIPSFQGITVAKTIKLAVAFKAVEEKTKPTKK
jgi:polyisoprenoid-binding protein YceI